RGKPELFLARHLPAVTYIAANAQIAGRTDESLWISCFFPSAGVCLLERQSAAVPRQLGGPTTTPAGGIRALSLVRPAGHARLWLAGLAPPERRKWKEGRWCAAVGVM